MQTITRRPRPENFSPARSFQRTRRPFAPTPQGTYRFPRAVHDRLTNVLEPYKNRDAAYALALHLARHWSTPNRIDLAFPVVRRKHEAIGQGSWGGLCDCAALGLSQGRIRGALEPPPEGRVPHPHDRADAGEVPPARGRRLVAQGRDVHLRVRVSLSLQGGQCAGSRGPQGGEGDRRAPTPFPALMASTAHFSSPKLPISKSPPERTVLMGKLDKTSGLPALAFDVTLVPSRPGLQPADERHDRNPRGRGRELVACWQAFRKSDYGVAMGAFAYVTARRPRRPRGRPPSQARVQV